MSTPAERVLTDAQKGVAGGIATLGDDGKLPPTEAPVIVGITVESCYQPGDTDDLTWARAVKQATTFGVRRVVGTKARYLFENPVSLDGINNLDIAGLGRLATVIASRTKEITLFTITKREADGGVGASNITFRDLGIDGGMTNASTMVGVSRDRSFVNEARVAVFLRVISDYKGDISGYTGYPSTENIVVDNVKMFGVKSLPVFLTGVYGEAAVKNCHIERCLDTGWTFCENAIALNNTVRWSADNGLSLSRGCEHVTAVGNTIYGSWYNGIWIAGFDGYRAPRNVTVTGNNIEYACEAGIMATDGPENVVISGNLIKDVRRGAINNSNDRGNGIYIAGAASGDAQGTIWLANNILISGNVLVDCQRSGVLLGGNVDGVTVVGNRFNRIGMPYAVNGTTIIPDADGNYNFAVGRPGPSSTTTKNILMVGNHIYDDRKQTLADGAVIPVMRYAYWFPGVASFQARANVVSGVRNAYVETWSQAVTMSGLYIGSDTAPDSRITFNGSSSANRMILFQVTESNRWALRTSGTNASTFALDAYNDAGSSSTRVLSIARATGDVAMTGALSCGPVTVAGTITGTRLNLGDSTLAADVRITMDSASSSNAKIIEFKAAGALRGTFRMDSAMRWHTYSDGGTATEVMTISRLTNAASFSRPVIVPSYTTATLTGSAASLFGAGAIAYNTTTKKLVASDGSAWFNADGSAV